MKKHIAFNIILDTESAKVIDFYLTKGLDTPFQPVTEYIADGLDDPISISVCTNTIKEILKGMTL